MPASEELKTLIDQMPGLAKNRTYVNMTDEKIEQIKAVVKGLREGGRDSVLGVIDMLVEPGKGDDVKAHYALHVLAVSLCGPDDDKERAAFAQAVASQVESDRPKGVRKYLIEQLQVAGGKEIVATLGKILLDAELCDHAARALAAIGDGAAEQLLAALPKVKGRSRLSLIKKLAVLRAKEASEVFKQALTDGDADIRIAGAWGIARIADASAADALLAAAEAHEGWERINETDACIALAEALAAADDGKTAGRIYAHLRKTRTDPSESHIRAAATR